MAQQSQPSKQRIFYKSLPKVELHRHLEGSLRLTTMMEIARIHKLDLPYNDSEKFRSLVQVRDGEPFNHQNFLSKFATLRHFYQSPEIIQQIVQECIADAADDNIRYLELRFTPVALTRAKDFPLGEAMDWVIEAVEDASQVNDVKTILIASVNRHESVALAEEVVQLTIDRKGRSIVGLDLAGGEADFPGDTFEGVFRQAREAGLRISIHAGEWGGPENIKLAIDKLGAERIGHGVRVLEDPKLVALCKERQIPFEVCPTSNYQSGVYKAIGDHPLLDMVNAGLNVTINTDDPGISQIDLSDEYQLACETLGLEISALRKTILDGIQAGFLPAGQRKKLVKSLEAEFAEKTATYGN